MSSTSKLVIFLGFIFCMLMRGNLSYAHGNYSLSPPIDQKEVKKKKKGKKKWFKRIFHLKKEKNKSETRLARVFAWMFLISLGVNLLFGLGIVLLPLILAGAGAAATQLFIIIFAVANYLAGLGTLVGMIGVFATKKRKEEDPLVRAAFITAIVFLILMVLYLIFIFLFLAGALA